MNNETKLQCGHIAIVCTIVAAIISFVTGLFRSPDGFDTALFLKAFVIIWVVSFIGLFAISFIRAWMTFTKKNNNENQLMVPPGVHYYYNDYHNGFSIVEKITVLPDGTYKNEFNYIDLNGNYLCDKWYSAVSQFNEFGVSIVSDKNMYNYINRDGKELSLQWFYDIEEMKEGIAKVRWNNNEINFITAEGKLLWPEWKQEIQLPEADGMHLMSKPNKKINEYRLL